MAGLETSEVLVVKKPVAEGTSADQLTKFVDTKTLPAVAVAQGAATDLDQLQGLVANTTLQPGEQVITARFSDPATLDKDATPPVPRGLQEVSLMLDSQRALGGNLAPGDVVGVFFSVEGETRLGLHDVLVSRVQGGLEEAASEESSKEKTGPLPETGVMVTLAVSAADAEKVVYAAENGTVWLSDESTDTRVAPRKEHGLMTLTILKTASEELGQRLRPLARATALPVPGEPRVSKVVILDCRPEAEPMLALAGELRREDPRIGLLLVSDRPSELGLAAMRAGVHDILSPEASLEDFSAAVEDAAHAADTRTAQDAVSDRTETVRTRGRVISVVSPKGGVGKTTVATNVAIGLAQRVPNSTVLVDLDVQFGDVGSALDLDPEHYLADAVQATAKRDSMVLKTFLTQHESGLYVLCAPSLPAEADKISPDDVTHLLRMLAAEFRYVVLDTAPGLSDTTLAALDETTDLVMLTSMDVPGVRGMRKELDAIAQIGQRFESRQIVLNLVDARGLLSVADVEDTIGTGVDLLLPRSKAVLTSVNQGVPLLQVGRRDPVTKQLRRLVDRLTTGDPAVMPAQGKPGRTASSSDQPVEADPRRTEVRWRRTRKALAS